MIDLEDFDAECARRDNLTALDDELFPEQRRFIEDPAYHKAALCARRSGKTSVFGVSLLRQALRFPRRKFLYLGLTKESAEEAIWTDTLERILLDRFPAVNGVTQYDYQSVDKLLVFRNGSSIRLGGVDASPRDMNRLLGRKYHEVAIDECQDHTQDLERLIKVKLQPLVNDYRLKGGGRILLGGTPGIHMGNHYWYRITKHDADGIRPAPDRVKGWSVHEWHCAKNPFYRKEFEDYCRELALVNPAYASDPDFRRSYLGQWVANDDFFIYRYSRLNALEDGDIKASLLRADPKWIFLIGVDLGWEDSTAIVVLAYSLEDQHCYLVESEKFNHTDLHDIGRKLHALRVKYHVRRLVLDQGSGTGKLSAESLRYPRDEKGQKLTPLPIYPAEKTEKESAITWMNSDFRHRKLLVIAEKNKALIEEWGSLQEDPKAREKGDFKEQAKQSNHLADAALYVYRDSRHRYADIPAPPAEPDFADALIARRRAQKALERETHRERRSRISGERELIDRFRFR